MVYCGKASQGCQNCRTRRIKCDKVKPECSQCIRVGKKCPGYRDQLSLMFRDESSKVIQKAHAQWGVGDASPDTSQPHTSVKFAADASASSASSTSSSASSTTSWSTSPSSVVGHRTLPLTPPSPASSQPSSSAVVPSTARWPPRLPTPVDPSNEEQGVQFYLNRYLIGHPDEPQTAGDLSSTEWLWDPSLQDIMTAVGLASLSNLRGDKSLMTTARQSYIKALRQTGQLIQSPVAPDFEVTMRGVVMLAMFEIVKGTHKGIAQVHAHVMGGVALLRRWCPMPDAAFRGVRAMVQMCFSLFIPAHLSQTTIPTSLCEWLEFSSSLLDPVDFPAQDLGRVIAQFIQLSAYFHNHVLSDGRPHTTSILQQLLHLDAELVKWEQGLDGTWLYRTIQDDRISPAAIFDGEYHIYYDMWAARMWAHYRWARILVNQTIVEFVNNYPISSLALISATELDRHLDVIRVVARGVLISTPSHWRHPHLEDKVSVEHPGGAGSGSAGLPVVLFQLKVAACAPGVPARYWDWTYSVMESMWSDLGMLHAKSMMEAMRAQKDSLQRAKADGILTHNG